VRDREREGPAVLKSMMNQTETSAILTFFRLDFLFSLQKMMARLMRASTPSNRIQKCHNGGAASRRQVELGQTAILDAYDVMLTQVEVVRTLSTVSKTTV
jgi:hypothetical protein